MSAPPATTGKEGTSSNKPICLPAGRYEFRDAGIYIGEWLDEKAVGLGLITKDKSQGEYTGLWDAGSEKSGVFLWPNAPGAMYEGDWSANRRNGFGVFNREDWVIMGKFKDDFITMGVKGKENTLARFEGRFENGFPDFGVETYGDGGTYSGEYKNGIREGLGVRKSIPYGEVLDYYPEAKSASNSRALEDLRKRGKLPSATSPVRRHHRRGSEGSIDVPCESDLEDGDELDADHLVGDAEPYTNRAKSLALIAAREREHVIRLLATRFKCGFVLTSQRSDLFIKRLGKLKHPRVNPFGCTHPLSGKRTQSLTELFSYPEEKLQNLPTGCLNTLSTSSTTNSLGRKTGKVEPAETDTLELDLVADDTIEVYSGEWFSDARHGHGICERSDGVAYYGQWFKNQRHGFGRTRFPDGTFEQGRYHNGKLIFLALPVGNKPHLVLYNRKIMKQVELEVEAAILLGEHAHKKAIEAREQVSGCVLDYVEKAKLASASAREYSLEARELVREMYPDFEQPGIKYLEDIVRCMRVTRRGSQTFEAALQSAKDVIAGIVRGLTRTGEESSDDENQQPEEDLTLPCKFTSQLNEKLAAEQKPISRAGSIRSQRRARIARMIRAQRGELTVEDIKEMGGTSEEKKAVEGDHSNPATQTKTDTTDGSLIKKSRAGEEEEDKLTPNGPIPKFKRLGKYDQLGLITNVSGNLLTKRTAGGRRGRMASKHQVYISKDEEDADGTYVEIPNMTEISHHYEIPSQPLTKLLANSSLFSNHFDYYSKSEAAGKVGATPTTFHHKPIQTQMATLAGSQIGTLSQPPAKPSPDVISIPVPQLTKPRSNQAHRDLLLQPVVDDSILTPSSTFSLTSINRLLHGNQGGSESQLQALKIINPSSVEIPGPIESPEAGTASQLSDLIKWLRSNITLIALICLNFFLLHIFFSQFGKGEEDE